MTDAAAPDSPGDPAAPAPLPPTPPPTSERALLHATEDTRTYPCTACGGSLVFDIATQKLGCPHCGAQHDPVEGSGGAVAEKDLRSTIEALRANAAAQVVQVAGEKEVVCQSCGGHTTFTGSLTATRCPYCATPIQRDDVHDAPARLAVDGVLPFRVDAAAARAALERWIEQRRFAPREFKRYKELGSFSSVYAAYFTYDAETVTEYDGARGTNHTRTTGSGENRRTETYTSWRKVSGEVHNRFDDLAVLANEGFDRKRVAALEPWPTQEAEPFSGEYLAGHLCRTYDHDVEHCFDEARQRMASSIQLSIRNDIGGDAQRIDRQETAWHLLRFKHLLLPIWLLTVVYAGSPYQVFINGVTGEVQGQRPYSKAKIVVAVAAAVAVLVVAYLLLTG